MSKFIRTINLLRIVALICLVVTITNAYSDVFEVNLAELGESKTSDEKQFNDFVKYRFNKFLNNKTGLKINNKTMTIRELKINTENYQMPGCALFVRNNGEKLLLIAKKQRYDRQSTIPCNINNNSNDLHTERQLALYAVNKLDPNICGKLYVYTRNAPCQAKLRDNCKISCLEFWKNFAKKYKNLTIIVYFSCNYNPMTENGRDYSVNLFNIITPSVDWQFVLKDEKKILNERNRESAKIINETKDDYTDKIINLFNNMKNKPKNLTFSKML